jgi:hypothetical protein
LLCEGIDIKPSWTLDYADPRCYKVVVTFKARLISIYYQSSSSNGPNSFYGGWNYEYDPVAQKWIYVYMLNDQTPSKPLQPRYTPMDFSAMFTIRNADGTLQGDSQT